MDGFVSFSISDPSIKTGVQAIGAILDRLVKDERLSVEHRPKVLAAILKREELGSAGIGGGVAIPHAKFSGVASVIGAAVQFPLGVEFKSLDGKLVHVVYLFVSPIDRPDEHLRVVELISQQLRDGPR